MCDDNVCCLTRLSDCHRYSSSVAKVRPPSPASFPTQTFWSINQSLGALLVLLNTDNGTKRSAKNIWVCWMCPGVTIQRAGHQSAGDHGSWCPHDHTAHLLLSSVLATTVTSYIPTIRDVNTQHQHSKTCLSKQDISNLCVQEEIVWRMSCRYMCLCRYVDITNVSGTV